MKQRLALVIIALLYTTYVIAAERKPLKSVATDAFTEDTQVVPKGTGDNHVAFAWWIPNEYWECMMSRDTSTSASDKKAMLSAISGVSLIAVVQADITALGALKYYSKDEIKENLMLSFVDTGGKKQKLPPMETIDPDLEVVLSVFKPILGAAMGNLGNSMHFFALNDKSVSSSRLLDPYQKGQINIQLGKRDNSLMEASIELPINSLFVPRKCPNGKDAHISWKYCPWTGKQLGE